MSHCFLLFNDNFISSDVINNLTASSEVTNFPKENAIDELQRTKLWRTEGYWLIESGSNTIVFEETASTPLTATVAAGEYSDTTAFLAAVKAALEAAGGSVYTVAVDVNTGKIKITSDGAGGGGILNLLWTDAGSLAMGDILGFDTAADMTGALTYTADVLRLTTGEFLVFDLGMSANPDGFALIGPRNEPINISPDAVVKLQGHEFNTWGNPSYEVTLTSDDEVYSIASGTGLHTDALRYWRLSIEDFSNPSFYSEVGYVYLGAGYSPDRGAAQFPLVNEQIDRSVTVEAEGGETFTDIRQKTQLFRVTFAALKKEEKEELQFMFDKYGKHTPFFVQMDIDLVFGTKTSKHMRFVKFFDSPTFTLNTPNNFSAQLVFREEL